MTKGKKIALSIVAVVVLCSLIFFGRVAFVLYRHSVNMEKLNDSYRTGDESDEYLSYEETEFGPILGFSAAMNGDKREETPNDAYYSYFDSDELESDKPDYLYYYYLDGVSPEKMLLVNEYRRPFLLLGGTNHASLLYQPEKVENPYRELVPTRAEISFAALKDIQGSDFIHKATVSCENAAFLAEFWQTLLDTPLEKNGPEKHHIKVKTLRVDMDIRLYLDSSELVYVDLELGTAENGKTVLVARGKDADGKSRYYNLPCTDVFQEALDDYITFLGEVGELSPDPEPAVTTQPAVTTESPAWSECSVMK